MVIRENTKSSFEEEKPVFELIEGVTFWIQDYWSKEAVVRVGFLIELRISVSNSTSEIAHTERSLLDWTYG